VLFRSAKCHKPLLPGLDRTLRARADQLFQLLPDEVGALPAQIAECGSLARYLVVIGDAQKEGLAAKLLEPLVAPPEAGPAEASPRKAGLLGALLQWLKK
jgi:hypothetical protein